MSEMDLSYIEQAVARAGRKPEALIPLLQALQDHHGYVPEAAMRRVCELTDITPAAMAGVSTFYDMFRHKPAGKHLLRVCRGTACHVSGAELVEDALRRHLKIPADGDTDPTGEFTIEPVACLGCCTLAPVLRIDGATMGFASAESAPNLIRDYLQEEAASAAKSTEEPTPRKANGCAEIHVGLGSCCMAKGSDRLFHALRQSAEESGAGVVVKRVGCVGMCHRTPLVEVAMPGRPGEYYSGLTAAEAGPLLQRYFKPAGLVRGHRACGRGFWRAFCWRSRRRNRKWPVIP